MTAPVAAPEIAEEEPPKEAVDTPAKSARGPLLDMDEEKAAKEAERLWRLNPFFHKLHAGHCTQHQMWRNGDRFVRLMADHENGTVRIQVPGSLDDLPPVPNKVEEQVRNAVSTIMSDPPKPECEPSNDTPQAREAAQFATRFLTALSTESGLNMDNRMYEALDMAATYRSSFLEGEHDPQGGGYVPLTIRARPSATTTADAETGAPQPDGSMDTRPFVTRYVGKGGVLSESPKDAQMTWQSGLKCNLLTSNQVRFLPRIASRLADAEGVVVARFRPLGEMKRLYPDVEAMDADTLHEIVRWKVSDHTRLLPMEFERQKSPDTDKGDAEEPKDDVLVCELKVYYKSCFAYPKGCEAVFVGGKYRVKDDVLYFENDEGMPEVMDVPLSQLPWEVRAGGGNCYGETPVRRLGMLDEMRTTLFTSGMEYLHRFSRPRWLLPQGTTVQPETLADDTVPVYFNPVGEPHFLQLPAYPQMGSEYLDRTNADMESIIGIGGPAMGQVAGSVRSADQTNTLIERSTIAITQTRENGKDAYERIFRILLQLARRYFTETQLVTFRGEDGAYQVKEFSRADFGSTKQVRVQRGTWTMMTPIAKNDAINNEVQAGGLPPDEAARLRRENIAGIVGLEDNPHLLRVKRQLGVWRQGPSDEVKQAQALAPPPAPPPPPQVDPASGQPIPAPPPPPTPIQSAAQAIFPLLPVDEEQPVALIRHQELARGVAEIEFYNHPPEWTQALIGAYTQAKQAAGIQTIAEQQQAQQAQMQQQQQAAQQQEQGKMQEKMALKQADHQFQLSRDAQHDQAAQLREGDRNAARATAGVP